MSPANKQLARILQSAPRLVIGTVAQMEELIRLLRQEIEIVQKRRLTEHPDLLKTKQRLAMDYNANMKAIAAQPELVKSLSAEAKDAVRDMARQLSAAVEENARMLRAAVGATQQLIQNIIATVKTELMPKQAYKNPAKAYLQLGTYSPTCRPVAIRTLA